VQARPGPALADKGVSPRSQPIRKDPPPDPDHLEVSVLPELPLLVPILPEGGPPLLMEGEGHTVTVELANSARQLSWTLTSASRGPSSTW